MLLKSALLTALAGVVAIPLMVGPTDAAAATCKTRKTNGTLLGAAGGALLGHAVGGNTTGTVVGGLGGAVVGREIGRGGCKKRVYYRSAAPRPAQYRSAPRAAEPRYVARKVYYDQYGTPISAEYGR